MALKATRTTGPLAPPSWARAKEYSAYWTDTTSEEARACRVGSSLCSRIRSAHKMSRLDKLFQQIHQQSHGTAK